MINEIDGNRIIYTNNLFKTAKKFKKTLIITPFTKISDLLAIKKDSIVKWVIDNELDTTLLVNEEQLKTFKDQLNDIIKIEYFNFNVPYEKLIKLLLEEEKVELTFDVLEKILDFYDTYALERMEIIIFGFDNIMKLVEKNYKMINIVFITNNISNIGLKWETLELLSFDTGEDFKIENKLAFKEWLELKTKTILKITDINDFLNGNITFNSYLIERAIKVL